MDTALQLIEKAILLDPEDSEYVYIKAGLCKDKRDYEGALKLYLQCESDYDQTPHFYANVGECYDSMGQKDEALSCWNGPRRWSRTTPASGRGS